MSENEFDNAMTKLEIIFKSCMELRPDIKSKILTLPELYDYLNWIDKENLNLKIERGEMYTEAEKMIGSSPLSAKLWYAFLTKNSSKRDEEKQILQNYDISVREVLRYFPAFWSSSSFFSVFYLYSGECDAHFKNVSIHLNEGAILIIAPFTVCASQCYSDDCRLLGIFIRASTFDQVFWNLINLENLMGSFFRMALSGKENMEYLKFDTGDDKDIKHLAYRMLKENMELQEYGSQMLNSMLTEFFLLVLRRYEGTAQLPKSRDFFWKQEYSAILSHIMRNYDSVSLENLSERFHYSQKQIARIVHKYTGKSFTDLILKLKMKESAKLLTETDLTINQISEAAGYSTLSTFYRAFNKYFGTSPQKFRLEANNTDIDS